MPAGVDDEIRPGNLFPVGVVPKAHSDGPPVLEQYSYRVMPFPHVDALGAAVVQQDGIEPGTPNLVCVGVGPVSFLEVPTPGCRIPAPYHSGAPLGQESRILNGGQRPQLFQHRNTGGQQRLAHVVSGEPFPFQEQHTDSLDGQHGGRGATGRAAANDDYVGAI